MKKIMSVFILTVVLSLSLSACGGGGNPKVDVDNLEYIENSEVASLYSNAVAFENRGVRFHGKIFSLEEYENYRALQVWVDVNGDNKNTIVLDFNSEKNYENEDFIFVDGFVRGEHEGENALGGKVSAPSIEAIEIKKSNYIDAFSPTVKAIEVNQEIDQYGAKIILEKVEFADNETRLYITISNETNDKFNIWTHSAKVIQESKQYEKEYNFDSDYPEIQSDLESGVKTEGILNFPKLDKDLGELRFIIDGSSSNWDTKIEPYEFNVNW